MRLRSHQGFTLVELLVVLLIIGVLMSFAPAAFHRISPRIEMMSSARQVAGLLREARSQAIRDNRDAVVIIDTEERWYRLARSSHQLDDAIRVELTTASSETLGEKVGGIRFFPDGTSTGGRVTLSKNERKYDIDVDWLTGVVRISE